MKKIEKLTATQQEQLREFRAEWLQVGICTERADRATTERAITEMYVLIGRTQPKFLWCESAATCILAIALTNKDNGASLGDSLWDSLRDSLGASLWASLGDSLWDSLGDSLWDSLRDSLGASLWASLWDSLGDSLGDSLRDSLGASLWASLGDSLNKYFWGQHEAYWIAYYLFPRDVLGVKYNRDKSKQLDLWRDIAKSCCWWFPFEGFVICSERPTKVSLDAKEKIHCENGPAVEFADGWRIYALHGQRTHLKVLESVSQHHSQEHIAEHMGDLVNLAAKEAFAPK